MPDAGLVQRIDELLDRVETSSSRPLMLRKEIGMLILLAEQRKMNAVFHDCMFLAKFISGAEAVLRRVGMESEDSKKLSAEFSSNLEKFSALLKTLVKEAPEEIKSVFVGTYFSSTHEGLLNLLQLAKELTLIKNYEIDHNHIL